MALYSVDGLATFKDISDINFSEDKIWNLQLNAIEK